MHHQCYCVLLLLIISLPNKSGKNASKLLHHPSTERWDTTTYFINSPRNQSVQTFREAFRENDTKEETNSTSTGREKFDEEEDEFAGRNVTKNEEGQAYANETRIGHAIPIRLKNGIYFTILPRDITTGNKNHNLELCCPLGYRLSHKQEKCIVDDNFIFPQVHESDKDVNFSVNLVFLRSLRPCEDEYRPYIIDPVIFPDNEYYFRDGEQVYFPHKETAILLKSFCVAAVNQTGFDLIMCVQKTQTTLADIGTFVSLIFLVITFVVYSVLWELRNLHGYILRAYIASQFVVDAISTVYLQVPMDTMDYSFCASLSFIRHFATYSAFLWQNVTCFDMWQTFRRIDRLHKNKVQPDRMSKKLIYSLYVWGMSSVVTILTIIMDFVPNIPNYLIKPNICKHTLDPYEFWLSTMEARIIYFYLPIGIILISNICFFVWTALSILFEVKHIKRLIRYPESRRHNYYKEKRFSIGFWIYLKLLVAMDINWIPIIITMELGQWMFNNKYIFLSVLNFIISLEGIIIFIMFVCTKNVMRLLKWQFIWSWRKFALSFSSEAPQEVDLAVWYYLHNQIE